VARRTASTESPLAIPETPIMAAIRWMREAGLPKARLAALLDVSRPTLDAWESGAVVPHDSNRQRLLIVNDILDRAARRLPDSWTLADWLDVPRGPDGVTPADLLRAAEFGQARLLAMSTPSPGLTRSGLRAGLQVAPRFRHLIEPRQTPRGAEPVDEPPLEEEGSAPE
jgi:hypothetical protein